MRRAPIAFALACGHAAAACPPADYPRARLDELKAAKWVVADDAVRHKLALGLADCLAAPDPDLRDGIAFEGLQFWMRSEKLDTPTVQALRSHLQAQLQAPDPKGFARPFAALVLADVARVDRRKPYLSPEERSALVRASSDYLQGVRDYRGFDDKEGWRHGVAHGADVMLQLSLNPALDKAAQETMLAAIGSQVLAADAHFYVYGEGSRLMAPVFYLAKRDTLGSAEWEAWITRLTDAARVRPPVTQPMLARMHNLKGFLLPLYAALNESQDQAQRARLLPIVTKTLKQFD
jgi:hypothetical protein